MIGEEILKEIDSTLDKLLENAQTIKKITNKKNISKLEVDSFTDRQEDLLAYLLEMDKLLEEKRDTLKISKSTKIQDKLLKLEKLHLRRKRVSPSCFEVSFHRRLKRRIPPPKKHVIK